MSIAVSIAMHIAESFIETVTLDAAAARVLVGVAVSTAIALVAWRFGSLSRSGALAAVLTGTAAVFAGWSWGGLLVAYFIVSAMLSRLGRARKERRTSAVVEKSGARDAIQVAANGGMFVLCALLAHLTGSALYAAAALGALAASTADTWATEIGTLAGGSPRSIVDFVPVPAGTSGGVSWAGTLAMSAGAAAIAFGAHALGLTVSTVATVAIATAGIAGALMDSVLGATLQERRRCPRCDQPTERSVHSCGTPTSYAGGMEWMTNDVVNFIATLSGAAVAAAVRAV